MIYIATTNTSLHCVVWGRTPYLCLSCLWIHVIVHFYFACTEEYRFFYVCFDSTEEKKYHYLFCSLHFRTIQKKLQPKTFTIFFRMFISWSRILGNNCYVIVAHANQSPANEWETINRIIFTNKTSKSKRERENKTERKRGLKMILKYQITQYVNLLTVANCI